METFEPTKSCLSADPCSAACPSRAILDLVGDRWSLLVMLVVGRGTRRNGALKREIAGISQKMLTQTLRALEAHWLIRRIDFKTVPPHVEYELTDLGRSLETALQPLHQWVEANFDMILTARASSEDQAGRVITASNFARKSSGIAQGPLASV